jgi:hypothetical protein
MAPRGRDRTRSAAHHSAEDPTPAPSLSRARALAAVGVEIDRPVGNGDPEGRADRTLDQADLAAVRAHQFGNDGKPEPDAAGAGRALEGFE